MRHVDSLCSPASPLLPANLLWIRQTFFPKITKFASSWAQLTNNPSLFAGQSNTSTARFFSDLFCLGVSPEVLVNALKALSTEELLGPYKVSSARSD